VQVLCALQNAPVSSAGVPGLAVEPLEFDVIPTAFDLMLTMAETPGGLRGTAIYRTDLFERDTIALMLAHLRVILETVAADPECRVLEIPLSASDPSVGPGVRARAGADEAAEFDFGDAP
jgi:non-ribosomal peptide synthetase component F